MGEVFLKICRVLPLSESSARLAIQFARRHSLSHWDANIIAAALLAGCGTLYSEDMQAGRVLEGRLMVVNPIGSGQASAVSTDIRTMVCNESIIVLLAM